MRPLPAPRRVSPPPARLALPVALALAAPLAAAAEPPPAWALDPVHTRVLVEVEHAGFSRALGTVSGSQGVLLFDPDRWDQARVQVDVPLARLDFGDGRWNRAVRGRRLLDTDRHPVARFVAGAARSDAPGRAEVCGELSLRGVTRPLCMQVVLNSVGRHPLPPFRRTVGFSATATLQRGDFGMDAWPGLIGEQVRLRIEAEAVRTGAEAGAALAAADAGDAAAAAPDEAGTDLAAAAAAAARDDRAAAEGTDDPATGAQPSRDPRPEAVPPDPAPPR